jgi:hypothetical protein
VVAAHRALKSAIACSRVAEYPRFTWWQSVNISAMEIAKRLWEQSRKNPTTAETMSKYFSATPGSVPDQPAE